MDEMRKTFEDFAGHRYGEDELSFSSEDETYDSWLVQDAWEAWQASRSTPPIAYMTHHGSAVSHDDFADGEEEMHQAAKTEGWTPLIAGITGGVN